MRTVAVSRYAPLGRIQTLYLGITAGRLHSGPYYLKAWRPGLDSPRWLHPGPPAGAGQEAGVQGTTETCPAWRRCIWGANRGAEQQLTGQRFQGLV